MTPPGPRDARGGVEAGGVALGGVREEFSRGVNLWWGEVREEEFGRNQFRLHNEHECFCKLMFFVFPESISDAWVLVSSLAPQKSETKQALSWTEDGRGRAVDGRGRGAIREVRGAGEGRMEGKGHETGGAWVWTGLGKEGRGARREAHGCGRVDGRKGLFPVHTHGRETGGAWVDGAVEGRC